MTRPTSDSRDDEIVVTGTGLWTSLGKTVDENWQALAAGRDGFTPVSTFELGDAKVRDAALAPPLEGDARTTAYHDGRQRALAHLEAVVAEALAAAGLPDGKAPDPANTALLVGSSLAASASSATFWDTYLDQPDDADFAALQSYDVEPMLDRLCERFGVGGEALLVANACAAGGSAVALGFEMLRTGACDLAIVCGFDTLEMHTFSGFHSLDLLTPVGLRPFAADRQGMKLGDGFAALVLERAGDAARAGRRPRARLLGCGDSGDAHSLTQPHPEGLGAALAMQRALASAGRSADEVDYVSLHATCTPSNDLSEYQGLLALFGAERLERMLLHAAKPALGHTLGAAGTVDAVLTVEVLRRQIVPATLGLADELEFEHARFARQPTERPVGLALSNAFGFGGANSAILLAPSSDRPGSGA
jgi:3-oxoacyl-(acyl-carrier-protein) synthase